MSLPEAQNDIMELVDLFFNQELTKGEFEDDLEEVLLELADEVYDEGFQSGVSVTSEENEEVGFERGYGAALTKHGIVEVNDVV